MCLKESKCSFNVCARVIRLILMGWNLIFRLWHYLVILARFVSFKVVIKSAGLFSIEASQCTYVHMNVLLQQ